MSAKLFIQKKGRGGADVLKEVKGVKRYKLPVMKWVSDGDVMYSIRNIVNYVLMTDVS